MKTFFEVLVIGAAFFLMSLGLYKPTVTLVAGAPRTNPRQW
jgi:hypothetical protein